MQALTDKQAAFCREYRVDFNAKQAAIRAGYSARSAAQTAYDLLKREHIQARIRKLVEGDARRNDVSVDRVLQEYAKLAFSNLNDFLEIDPVTGEAFVTLGDCTEDQIAALTEYTVDTYTEGKGESAQDVKRIKIKLSDKRAALDSLARHLGMFAKDNNRTIDPSEKMNDWLTRLNESARPFSVSPQSDPALEEGV